MAWLQRKGMIKMKVKIICKCIIRSNNLSNYCSNIDLNYDAKNISKVIEDAVNYLDIKSKYEKTLEFGIKDIDQALRFFTPRSWGLKGNDAAKKFIECGYKPIGAFIEEQHKVCNTIISTVNLKYPNNNFELTIKDRFNPQFKVETNDVFQNIYDINSFGSVNFVFSIVPSSCNTPYYIYYDKYKEKMQNILTKYNLQDSFKLHRSFSANLCPIFELLDTGESIKLFRTAYGIESFDQSMEDIDAKLANVIMRFKEENPVFVKEFNIELKKHTDVRIVYSLNAEDVNRGF